MAGTIESAQTRPQDPTLTSAVVGTRGVSGGQINNSRDVGRQYDPTDLKSEMATEAEVAALSPPLLAKVTVTSAEILALFTTPKVLLPAPPAGSFNIVESITVLNDFNSAAYVVNAAGLTVRYTDGSGDTIGALSQGFGQLVADGVAQISDIALDGVTLQAAVDAAVVLFAGVANPTTGDGELKFSILFRVVRF